MNGLRPILGCLAGFGLFLLGVPGFAQTDAALKLRADAERRAAVGMPGVQVCRQASIGIGLTDLVRGTVLAAEGNTLRVRIDAPGRLAQRPDGTPLQRGEVVAEPLQAWRPCMH